MRHAPKKYEFDGSLYTARELQELYNIPDRLVWKAYNDPKFPSLKEMIEFRASHGINDVNDFRCRGEKKSGIIKEKKKRTYSFRFTIPQPIVSIQPSLPEYFPAVEHEYRTKIDIVSPGEKFGAYLITSVHNKGRLKYVSAQCTECGKSFYDLPCYVFLKYANSYCTCEKFRHVHVIKNMPIVLMDNLLKNGIENHSAFYESFIGTKMCGIEILSVSKKENADCCYWIFGGRCPVCGATFSVRAFDLITGRFHHGCSRKKKYPRLKNGSAYTFYRRKPIRVRRTRDEDSITILSNSMSNFSLNYGTESFMNLHLDAQFCGKQEQFYNYYGI